MESHTFPLLGPFPRLHFLYILSPLGVCICLCMNTQSPKGLAANVPKGKAHIHFSVVQEPAAVLISSQMCENVRQRNSEN